MTGALKGLEAIFEGNVAPEEMSKVLFSDNTLSCALLFPDSAPDPVKVEAKKFLTAIAETIVVRYGQDVALTTGEPAMHDIEARGKTLYQLNVIKDGIQLDPRFPNKGSAIEDILVGDGFIIPSNRCEETKGLFLLLGDDVTDQKMFDKLKEKEAEGSLHASQHVSILVGARKPWEPLHRAVADYRVKDEAQAQALLESILTCEGELVVADGSSRPTLIAAGYHR